MNGDQRSTGTPIVLSPDRTQFWDGTAWKPALLSPDGLQVWDGNAWHSIPGVSPSSSSEAVHAPSETIASVLAVTICGVVAIAVLFVGSLISDQAQLRLLVEAVAALPVLMIPNVQNALLGAQHQRDVGPPTTSTSRPAPASTMPAVSREGNKGTSLQSVWLVGLVVGTALGVFSVVLDQSAYYWGLHGPFDAVTAYPGVVRAIYETLTIGSAGVAGFVLARRMSGYSAVVAMTIVGVLFYGISNLVLPGLQGLSPDFKDLPGFIALQFAEYILAGSAAYYAGRRRRIHV